MVLKTAAASAAVPSKDGLDPSAAANGGGPITAQTLQQKIDDGTTEVSTLLPFRNSAMCEERSFFFFFFFVVP